jgi:hypothetical protein
VFEQGVADVERGELDNHGAGITILGWDGESLIDGEVDEWSGVEIGNPTSEGVRHEREISNAGRLNLNFSEIDQCKPVLLGLSLAGNLVKPLLFLYGTKWRERGYGLSHLIPVLEHSGKPGWITLVQYQTGSVSVWTI